MIYFADRYQEVEFRSSLGRRIDDFPPVIRLAIRRLSRQISRMPDERNWTKLQTKAERSGITAGRIAELRYDYGITTSERFEFLTSRNFCAVDFAGGRNGLKLRGPNWYFGLHAIAVDGLRPIRGYAQRTRRTNLEWPAYSTHMLEPEFPNTHLNGYNPIAPLLGYPG